MPGLIIIVARIDLQGLVCPVAEDTLDGLLVVFCRHIAWCEKGTLIAVGHHNHGYIIILATLVETVLVVGDHIAVDTGPEAGEAHVAVTERHGVHLPQLLEVLFLQVLLEGQTLLLSTLLRGVHTQRTGLVTPWGKRASTLTDAGTEEPLCQGRGTEHTTADGSSTLAEDGDLRGVAAKVGNVALHPFEGEDLVEQTVVAGVAVFRLFRQLRMGHEAQGTRTVLNAHDDHTPHGEVLPQVTAIPLRLETTAMDPYHHGQLVVDRGGRRRDAEIETILAHHVCRTTGPCRLRRHESELVAHSHTLP